MLRVVELCVASEQGQGQQEIQGPLDRVGDVGAVLPSARFPLAARLVLLTALTFLRRQLPSFQLIVGDHF